jgi:hypothetical protein
MCGLQLPGQLSPKFVYILRTGLIGITDLSHGGLRGVNTTSHGGNVCGNILVEPRPLIFGLADSVNEWMGFFTPYTILKREEELLQASPRQ